MTEAERKALDFALAQLRMAYDLRNAGDPEAQQYERAARRVIAEVADVDYDLMREEGNRPGEISYETAAHRARVHALADGTTGGGASK